MAAKPVYEAPRQRLRATVAAATAAESGLEADCVAYRPRVYKIPMVRMSALAGRLTNPRMYGSIRRPYRNVWVRSSAAGVV